MILPQYRLGSVSLLTTPRRFFYSLYIPWCLASGWFGLPIVLESLKEISKTEKKL